MSWSAGAMALLAGSEGDVERYQEPAELLRRALELEPNCEDPYVHAALGEALLKLDSKDPAAKRHLVRAVELNDRTGLLASNPPFLSKTYSCLGLVELLRGESGYHEAAAYCRKALGVHEDSRARQTLSYIETKRRQSPQTVNRARGTGGRFIATVAYGSETVPEVRFLKSVRDDRLARSASGRGFVRGYYVVSPFVARRLSRWPRGASGARRVIDLLVLALAGLGIGPREQLHDDSPPSA